MSFGRLAVVVALGGLLSGALLAFHYAPTFEAARDATAHVETLPLGRLLRSLHHWAGTFTLVLAGLHGILVFARGGHRADGKRLWVLGSFLFLVLLGFSYTGYLLPGDERGLAGIKVMEGVASSAPVVGGKAAAVLRGGDAISSATLTRLYAVHAFVLPAALALLLAAFVASWRRARTAPPRPLLLPAAATLALLLLAALLFPPALGAKADFLGEPPPDARPEWFFLWVNELLYRVPGNVFLLAGLLPALLAALAIGLPYYARGRRGPEVAAALAVALGIGGLTAASLARAPEHAAGPPATAAAPAADVPAILRKFQCARCHSIDGAASADDTGPPINRTAAADHPAVKDLFTREFFRRKVGDPRKYWDLTSMNYTPTRLKPTPEELAALEAWFFDR
ncbi:MAG TPA: cytochrome b N-terminal domain-containing protein [Planctomycetota bacterium]|nr:cytochrome b N-terminal domain-containing protein [Planctomycetota bacterium]